MHNAAKAKDFVKSLIITLVGTLVAFSVTSTLFTLINFTGLPAIVSSSLVSIVIGAALLFYLLDAYF